MTHYNSKKQPVQGKIFTGANNLKSESSVY